MTIKTQFKGAQMVPKDVKFPEIGELKGDFGKEVLTEYKGRTEKDYGNAEVLKVLSYSDGKVVGSNPFAVVLVNQIVRESGLRTATPADLERALQAGIDLSGTYEDTGLVLRSEGKPNEYLAKNLMAQLKVRAKKVKMPQLVYLSDLDLEKDANSPQGLRFKLITGAKPIYAPILNKGGNFTSEDIDFNTGLPKKVGEGNRTLYTRQAGLSGLYLDRDLDLRSDGGNLAYSDSDGRVRVVSAEGTSPKILSEYLTNLQAKRDAEIAQVKARYAKAEKVLLG